MANDLTQIVRAIARVGMLNFRQSCNIAKFVTVDGGSDVKEQGNVIEFDLPQSMGAPTAVTPGSKTATDVKPKKRSIELSNWFHKGFALSDKERDQILADQVLKGQSLKAMESLVDYICGTVRSAAHLAAYKAYGTSGQLPGQKKDLIQFQRTMSAADPTACPAAGRGLLLNTAHQAELLLLDAFTNVAASGSNTALSKGELPPLFGFERIASDQGMDTLSLTSCGLADLFCAADIEAGAVSGSFDTATGGTWAKGERFLIAGDTTVYVTTAELILAPGVAGTLYFWPPLQVKAHNNDAVTLKGSEAGVSLAIHKDAMVLAMRPLKTDAGLGVISETVSDPDSGLAIRLEVERSNFQTVWTWDALWGVDAVYPAGLGRLIG